MLRALALAALATALAASPGIARAGSDAPPAATQTTTIGHVSGAGAPDRTSERFQVVGCDGEAAEFEATLADRIVLDRAFLDGSISEDENVRVAVRQQLKYLWGYFRTRLATHSAQRLVLSADEPAITIVKKSTAPYGRELSLAWTETEPRLQITDAYTVNATKRGVAHYDDPALVADYEVRFKLVICGEVRAAESSIEVPLPDDPWLLYFHVPRTAHRLMRYYDETAVTNPCSDDDFADLPLPFYYWYDWQPDRNGPDAEGIAFDCRALLHEGVDFYTRTVRLTKTAEPRADFERMRAAFTSDDKPLSMTVLIGVLDHAWKDLGYGGIQQLLGAGSGRTLRSRAERILDGAAEVERGTGKFLRLLADLAEVMRLERYASAVADGYLRVDVDGKLLRSGRAMHVKLYVGLTDIFGPEPPRHWDILRRGLEGDHLVVYAGHSGIGENFRLSQIEQHLGLDPSVFAKTYEKAPFQLIAFLSCYSYMYFGQDLLKAADTSVGKEFVYTGSEFTRGDRGTLAILSFVDAVLARSGAAAGLPARYVAPSDFVMLKGRW